MVVVTLRTVTERVRSLARSATLRVGVRFQGCDVMRGAVKECPQNHPDHRITEKDKTQRVLPYGFVSKISKAQNRKGTTLWI